MRQADLVYRDALTTSFVSSHRYPNNLGHVSVTPNAHFENPYERAAYAERLRAA